VSPDTAAKIRALAKARGISESEIVRTWLEYTAEKVVYPTFEAEVKASVEAIRAQMN
jgi:hypothetical protein